MSGGPPLQSDRGVDVVGQIRAVASRTPGAVAIVDGERTLSYAELVAHSGALSAVLRGLRRGRDEPIGVAVPRGLEAIVALVGAMDAGAYCPIDVASPAARTAALLEEAGATTVVVLRRQQVSLPDHASVVVYEDALASGASGLAADRQASELAYVISTSGSTGRPKAVGVETASLRSLVDWHLEAFGVTAADRGAQGSRMAFDASIWETIPYLAAGAQVHVMPGRMKVFARSTAQWLVDQGITMAFLPSAQAELLFVVEWPDAPPPALRWLFTGADRLRSRPPATFPCPVVNAYGPTEATVLATTSLVVPGDPSPPAIGRPVAGTSIHLVDAEGRPVVGGEQGEIWIGGEGLARGYLGRPDLTAMSFVADPFSSTPGARVYKTGDLGRWRSDGELAFVGRVDEQVKVRGHRVELGDVEAALAGHPAVEHAAVFVAGDGASARLNALVVAREGDVTIDDIRRYTSTCLPDYMVPTELVFVETLPLTANGKIDRAAVFGGTRHPQVKP